MSGLACSQALPEGRENAGVAQILVEGEPSLPPSCFLSGNPTRSGWYMAVTIWGVGLASDPQIAYRHLVQSPFGYPWARG